MAACEAPSVEDSGPRELNAVLLWSVVLELLLHKVAVVRPPNLHRYLLLRYASLHGQLLATGLALPLVNPGVHLVDGALR